MADLVNEEARDIINEGGVPNINVLSTERGPTDDPELIGPLLAEQLEQFGGVAPAIDEATPPSGEAIKAS